MQSGGNNSNNTFEYIDYENIMKNPKIICGYSDITSITNIINAKTGLVTFSGTNFKTIATDETDYSFKEALKRFVDGSLEIGEQGEKYLVLQNGKCQSKVEGKLMDSQGQVEGKLLKFQEQIEGKLIKCQGQAESKLMDSQGQVEGKLVGGNLCLMHELVEGKFKVDFEGKILFLEELGMETEPAMASNYLAYMKQNGVFDKINGLWIGSYEHESGISLEKILFDVLELPSKRYEFPIIKSNNFGHVETKTVIPIGTMARIDTSKDVKIELIEQCVK